MKIISFFISILILEVVHSQINMKNIQDGKKYQIEIKKGQSSHFLFETDFKSNQEVQFQFQNDNLYSFMNDINVYLSQKNQIPNESRFSHKCENVKYYQNCEYKYDMNHIIHESKDKQKQRLFMTIECSDAMDCSFNLRIMHSKQLVLALTDDTPEVFQVRSNKDDFYLYLPLPINNTDYEYLIIEVDVIQVNHDKLNNGFTPNIRSNDNYNITQFSDDHRMLAIIDKNENHICDYCYFPFIIQLPSSSLFQLKYHKRKYNQTELKLNQKMTDNLKPKIFKTYVIRDMNISNSYRVSVQNINGNHKTLYVNPVVQPNERNKYEWISSSFRDTVQDDIIITTTDLQRIVEQTQQQTVDIHIGLYSQNYGLFSISINDVDDHQIPLTVGSMESGTVINDQIINYKLSIWNHQQKQQDQKQKVNMMMITETGMIDVIIHQCNTSRCQSISESDFYHDKKTKSYGLLGYQTHSFSPDCQQSNEMYCYYMIGLKGRSTSDYKGGQTITDKSLYSLRIYYENGFQVLHQGQPQQIHIISKVTTRLKYVYSDSVNELDRLKFSISNNNVDFIVKSGKQCYMHMTVDKNDKECQQFRGDSLLAVEVTRQQMSSNTFYIIVYSPITTNALVEVQVYKSGQQSINSVYLHYGISYNSQLSQQQPIQYFRFNVDYRTNQDILVNINGISQDYIMKGRQGRVLPDDMSYDWISNDNLLIINYESNPTAYTSNGEYIIMVQSVHPIREQNVQFTIQYYIPSQTMNIHLNQPIYNELQSNGQSMYYFYVDHDIEDSLYIMTHIIHNSKTEYEYLEVSINNQPKHNPNNLLNRQWHQQQESVDGYDWQQLILEPVYVNQLCHQQKTIHNINQCRLYIQISNHNEIGLQYMLQIQHSRNRLIIQEGKQSIIDSQSVYQHKIVQTILVPEKIDQNIDIQLQSYSNHFSVELSVQSRYTQENKRLQQSYHKNRHLFIIQSDDMIHCKPNCVIKSSIFFDKQDQVVNQNSQFRIYVDAFGQVTQIQDTKQYTFSIQKEQMKYFRYDFMNQDSHLQTQINAIHGKYVVYYKLCLNNELVFPTSIDYDSIQFTDRHQLEKQDIQRIILSKHDKIGNRQNGIQNMFMMIGVGLSKYGNQYNEGLFEMKINHKYSRYYSLYINSYQQFYVSDNDYGVFKIYNSGHEQIQLKMVMKSGQSYSIKYNECEYDQNNIKNQFTNCVNDIKQQKDIQSQIHNDQQILMNLKINSNCDKCMIVVVVQAIDSELEGMIMIKKYGQPESLNQQITYRQQLKQNEIQGYQILQYGRFNNIHLKVTLIAGRLQIYQQNNSTYDTSDQNYYILDKTNNMLDITIDRNDNSNKGLYGLMYYFYHKYIYVQSMTDCIFSISYSYSKNQIQQLNEGELVTSYYVKEQVQTKNFRFECKRDNSSSCYVSIFQNYRNNQNNTYNIRYLTTKFSYQSITNDMTNQKIRQKYNDNTQYLDPNQIQIISSGSKFITYKILYDYNESKQNPSNMITMDIKMNETMIDNQSFLFDIIKYNNRNLVIPQNGELTLIDDNRSINTIQVYIEDNGYLMVDVQQCIGDIIVQIEIRKQQNSDSLMYEISDDDIQSLIIELNQPQYIRVNQGVVTIKVISLDQMIVSRIKTRYLTDSEYINEEMIQISDMTDFNIHNINDDNRVRIQVSIQPVLCLNCEQLNSKAYADYKLIISDKPESIMKAGLCELCEYQSMKQHNYIEKDIKNMTINYQNMTIDGQNGSRGLEQKHQLVNGSTGNDEIWSIFELDNTGVVYYIQPIVIIKNTLNQNDRLFIYPMKELINPIWYKTKKGIFTISLTIISIIVLVFMIYMIRTRSIMLQKKIKYEMSDIRNITSIRGDQTFEMSQMVQIKGVDAYQSQRL